MLEINVIFQSLFIRRITRRAGRLGEVCFQSVLAPIKAQMNHAHRPQEQFGHAYFPVNCVTGASGTVAEFSPITI